MITLEVKRTPPSILPMMSSRCSIWTPSLKSSPCSMSFIERCRYQYAVQAMYVSSLWYHRSTRLRGSADDMLCDRAGAKAEGPVYNACMFHCGFRASLRSSFVPTNSFGMRLTRYAPARMLWFVRADTPLWLLRIEPESEAVSLFLKRGGGAKSSAVKVPDLRSK